MAVPRNRHSNARKNSKRSHHAKRPLTIVSCKNCQQPHLPHRACVSCGYYNGRSLLPNESTEQA